MALRFRAIPRSRASGNVQIPLPIYRLVSVGGDSQLTANVEYRIPIVSQVTFAFFTDFGMTGDLQAGPAAAERGRRVGAFQPDLWLPDVRERRVLWRPEGQLPDRAAGRCRTPTSCRACRTARSCR